MKFTKKGYTLVEILVTSAVFMLMILGFVRLITFQGQMLARSRTQQVLQHQASYTLRHIRKYVAGAATVNLEAGEAGTDGRRPVSKIELIGRDGTQKAEYELIGSVLWYQGEPIADKVDGFFTRSAQTEGLRKFDIEVVTGDAVVGFDMTLGLVAPVVATRVEPLEAGTVIYTWEDLHNVRNDMSGEYRMGNDLDKDSPYYAEYGADFKPIGYGSDSDTLTSFTGEEFNGIFDGAGYVIRDLKINKPAGSYVALFSNLRGEVKNLGIGEGSSVSGDFIVGGIAGRSRGGRITNCYNAGDISGRRKVGGVVGITAGGVTDCHNTGTVSGTCTWVGGVAGYAHGLLNNNHNTGIVVGGVQVGGVVGMNGRTTSNCYNTGDVSGDSHVGGVAGMCRSDLIDNYNSGRVSDGQWYVGGVVGKYIGAGVIVNCYNVGEVSGGMHVGGVAGWLDHTIQEMNNCYNAGDIFGNNHVGGVVGGNRGTIRNSHNTGCEDTGIVGSVEGNQFVGGVVGRNYSTIENCSNIGDVEGGDEVGGVVGKNEGAIEDSYNTGNVTGKWEGAGGVSGWNVGSIRYSRNTGEVNGTDFVGGLAGANAIDSSIENSYNNGVVKGGDSVGNRLVGGVVGRNSGMIRNTYNTGDVPKAYTRVGGLVGFNDSYGTIENSYNTGDVRCDITNRVGGVVGRNEGTVRDSYNTGRVDGDYDIGGVAGENWATVTGCYFSDGPDNGIGTSETSGDNFYASGHVIYTEWETPPWSWPGGDYPKLGFE